MSPARELALYLQTNGVGIFGGNTDWSIHVSREPTTPNKVITLYDTGGSSPSNYGIALRNPTIQVRVRTDDYDAGQVKHQEIFGLFNAIQTAIIESNTYLGVYLTTDVLSIGRDDNDRHLLTANYQVQRG